MRKAHSCWMTLWMNKQILELFLLCWRLEFSGFSSDYLLEHWNWSNINCWENPNCFYLAPWSLLHNLKSHTGSLRSSSFMRGCESCLQFRRLSKHLNTSDNIKYMCTGGYLGNITLNILPVNIYQKFDEKKIILS